MNEENIINKEMVEEFENVIKEFKDFRKNNIPLCAAENVISDFSKIPLKMGLQERYILGGYLNYDIIHFLRREMLDFTAFPVFFVSNLLLVQRKKYYFNRAMVSRNCSIVL